MPVPIDLRLPRKRTSSIDERGHLVVTTSAGAYNVRDIPLPGEVVEQNVVEVVDPMQALEQGLISSEKVVEEEVFEVVVSAKDLSAVPQWSGFSLERFAGIFLIQALFLYTFLEDQWPMRLETPVI